MKTTLTTALIGTLIAGCATEPITISPASTTVSILATDCRDIGQFGPLPSQDGLTWELNPRITPQTRVCWETVAEQPTLAARCAQPASWNGQACVMSRNRDGTCWVSSTLTVAEAQRTGVYTPASLVTGKSHISVYQHEIDGHCAGYDHAEASVKSLLGR